jgi:hypothetical protein
VWLLLSSLTTSSHENNLGNISFIWAEIWIFPNPPKYNTPKIWLAWDVSKSIQFDTVNNTYSLNYTFDCRLQYEVYLSSYLFKQNCIINWTRDTSNYGNPSPHLRSNHLIMEILLPTPGKIISLWKSFSPPEVKSSHHGNKEFIVSWVTCHLYRHYSFSSLSTVRPAYKGYSMEPENVYVIRSCPFYTG